MESPLDPNFVTGGIYKIKQNEQLMKSAAKIKILEISVKIITNIIFSVAAFIVTCCVPVIGFEIGILIRLLGIILSKLLSLGARKLAERHQFQTITISPDET